MTSPSLNTLFLPLEQGLIEVKSPEFVWWDARAIKIQYAIGRVDADDQLRRKARHLIEYQFRFRLRKRLFTRPATRVFFGAFAPIRTCFILPIGCGEVAIQINATGIRARWLLG